MSQDAGFQRQADQHQRRLQANARKRIDGETVGVARRVRNGCDSDAGGETATRLAELGRGEMRRLTGSRILDRVS